MGGSKGRAFPDSWVVAKIASRQTRFNGVASMTANMRAFTSALQNVRPTTPPLTIGRITWNIYKWDMQ